MLHDDLIITFESEETEVKVGEVSDIALIIEEIPEAEIAISSAMAPLALTVEASTTSVVVEELADIDFRLLENPDIIVLAAGNIGLPGPVGPQGPQGFSGVQGPQGAQGTQGPQGAQGPQGTQGNPGPTGPQGATGTGILMKGSVATVGNLPSSGNQQGDAYIVQADDSLHIWNGTAWVSGGSIQGPPGAQGPQGIQGAQGPQGIKGDTGTQGVQGPQGIKGDTGNTGATGSTGPQGPTGATGAQGPIGPTGAAGVMAVYQQSAEPVGAPLGALWITSETPPIAVGYGELTYEELLGS